MKIRVARYEVYLKIINAYVFGGVYSQIHKKGITIYIL
jgi:hypothetical protein